MEGSPKTCGNNQQVNLCAWHALRDSTNVNVDVSLRGVSLEFLVYFDIYFKIR